MARASAQAENRALSGIFASSSPTVSTTSHWVSLHVADPGTTGASENAGTGSYARQQYSVSTPSAGACSNTGAITFSTLGSVQVTHIGTYDAVSAGNYEIGAQLNSPVTAASITFAVGAVAFSAA
jgi:hypothetical protein